MKKITSFITMLFIVLATHGISINAAEISTPIESMIVIDADGTEYAFYSQEDMNYLEPGGSYDDIISNISIVLSGKEAEEYLSNWRLQMEKDFILYLENNNTVRLDASTPHPIVQSVEELIESNNLETEIIFVENNNEDELIDSYNTGNMILRNQYFEETINIVRYNYDRFSVTRNFNNPSRDGNMGR